MIKSGYLGFLLFIGMMLVFFVLPDLKGLQKPFRILLGMSFGFTYLALLIKGEISRKTLWPVIIGGLLILFIVLRGTFQAALINAYLCMLGLFCIPKLYFTLSPIRKTNLNYVYALCILSFIFQFLIFKSEDGRPSLAYQFNAAGAYLFLFFIFSDVIGNKYGKFLVLILSIYMRCRLLIFSILLFYLVRYGKKYFRPWLEKINSIVIIGIGYVFITILSVWYVTHVKSDVGINTGTSRIVTLNDDSNQIRFLANVLVLGSIYKSPLDSNILFGFGPVEKFLDVTEGAVVMPHNELYDAIIEFGIVTLVFFSLFSLPVINKVSSYSNMEYFLPVLFHTLILWVRFLLIPSFEMIFILFMLYILREQKLSLETVAA